MEGGGTHVVFYGPVAELGAEDLEELLAAPALFAVGVVGEVVGEDFSEAVFEAVGSRPWIARGYDDGSGWNEDVWLITFSSFRLLLWDYRKCHGG